MCYETDIHRELVNAPVHLTDKESLKSTTKSCTFPVKKICYTIMYERILFSHGLQRIKKLHIRGFLLEKDSRVRQNEKKVKMYVEC